MFTGLVAEIGTIKNITRNSNQFKLEITAREMLQDIKIGDSIAVNGICLTVTDFSADSFVVDVAPVTLQKTSLENAAAGLRVNLEPALKLQDRLGGHLVTGHINTTAHINFIQQTSNSVIMRFTTANTKYLVSEGSICLDGISLTLAKVDRDGFSISVIPHTWQNTNLHYRKIGDRVNLEFDIIAKYTEKLLKHDKIGIDKDFLRKHGF
jgi:riboflavin synthase